MKHQYMFFFLFSSKETRDFPTVDDDPLYARTNEIPNVQPESGMHVSGSKSKPSTGRGKKSYKYWNCK